METIYEKFLTKEEQEAYSMLSNETELTTEEREIFQYLIIMLGDYIFDDQNQKMKEGIMLRHDDRHNLDNEFLK